MKKVVDGNTFRTCTKVDGNNFVRIARKNAPEKYQFRGKQATQKLKRQIQGEVVTLQPVGRSYERTVAKVRKNMEFEF